MYIGGKDMDLLENEQIKDIENYEGLYAVTTKGRVYSYKSNKWLKPTANKRKRADGTFNENATQYYINLGRGSENRFYIHQLVAKTFIPNPNNYIEVDHIDTNSSNNNVENLRWIDHKQNMRNENTLPRISNNRNYLLEIREIATDNLYYGFKEASEKTGFHEETIRNHTKGKVKNPKWITTGRAKSPTTNEIIEI